MQTADIGTAQQLCPWTETGLSFSAPIPRTRWVGLAPCPGTASWSSKVGSADYKVHKELGVELQLLLWAMAMPGVPAVL